MDDLGVSLIDHELLNTVVKLLSLLTVFHFVEDFLERTFFGPIYLLFLIINARFDCHGEGSLRYLSINGYIIGYFEELLKLSDLLGIRVLILDEMIIYLLNINRSCIWIQWQWCLHVLFGCSYQVYLLCLSYLFLGVVLETSVRYHILVFGSFNLFGLTYAKPTLATLSVLALLLETGA